MAEMEIMSSLQLHKSDANIVAADMHMINYSVILLCLLVKGCVRVVM